MPLRKKAGFFTQCFTSNSQVVQRVGKIRFSGFDSAMLGPGGERMDCKQEIKKIQKNIKKAETTRYRGRLILEAFVKTKPCAQPCCVYF